MKNFLFKYIKKIIKGQINKKITAFILWLIILIARWIGLIPMVAFVSLLIVLITVSFLVLFIAESKSIYFQVAKYSITLCIISLVLSIWSKSRSFENTGEPDTVFICDEIVHHYLKTDSTGWDLYQKRNPDMLSLAACVLLEHRNDSLEYRDNIIKYADSLLMEANRANSASAYYYYGLSYMNYHGLARQKSVRDAVLYAQQSLNIQPMDPTYSLLESMNLDSIEYPILTKKIRLWRDSIDKVNVNKFWKIQDTFILSLSDDTDRKNELKQTMSSSSRKIDLSPEEIYKASLLFNSVYSGDSSSTAWKNIDSNIEMVKKLQPSLLAAYYWSKGDEKSAWELLDSIKGFYSGFPCSYDFYNLEIPAFENSAIHDFDERLIDAIEESVEENLEDILHYSSLYFLDFISNQGKDKLKKHVFIDTYFQRLHYLEKKGAIKTDINCERMIDSLTKETNKYIMLLRPNAK